MSAVSAAVSTIFAHASYPVNVCPRRNKNRKYYTALIITSVLVQQQLCSLYCYIPGIYEYVQVLAVIRVYVYTYSITNVYKCRYLRCRRVERKENSLRYTRYVTSKYILLFSGGGKNERAKPCTPPPPLLLLLLLLLFLLLCGLVPSTQRPTASGTPRVCTDSPTGSSTPSVYRFFILL